MLSLTRLGLCPYKKSICRAIHQYSLGYDVPIPHSRRHPTAGRHLVQRSWSSSTAVTSSARGLDVVSPLIGLSEEQSEFYRLSKAFADRELRPFASEWDKDAVFPLDAFRKLADLGFAGLFVREDVGGSALSRVDAVSIVEGLATGCVGTTAMLTIHNMCATLIDKYGSDDQRLLWLPQLVRMQLLVSFCLTEPGSGSDAGSLQTRAVLHRDSGGNEEYVLNGTKVFISGAGQSDLYLVMCRTGEDSISCIVVPRNTPGLSFGSTELKMGWNCQPTRQLTFDDVRVPASHRLGKEGEGFKIALSGLDGGRLSIGACSLGAAVACFDIAVKYTKERQQFGSTIASYQNTQFKLADMAGKIVSSRLMLRHAAHLLDLHHPAATVHCAMAKRASTDRCAEVCDEALQLLGGYGYLQAYEVERYVRDVRVHRILEGTNEIMQHIVGRAIVS